MTRTDLEALLARATPFLDVRAPSEYARGAVPQAVNLPLLDDDERHRVGLTYKNQGHDAAVALGHELVSGEVREAREQAWLRHAERHPDAWIYCWRGGQRSEIAQRPWQSRQHETVAARSPVSDEPAEHDTFSVKPCYN